MPIERTNAPRPTFGLSGVLIVTGCALVAISTALPWVHVVLLGDYNLFNLYDVTGRGQTVPALLVVGAVLAGVLTLARAPGHALVALIAGVIAIVRGLPDLRHAEHLLRLLNPLLTRGTGPVVFLIGVAIVVVGALASLLLRLVRVRR